MKLLTLVGAITTGIILGYSLHHCEKIPNRPVVICENGSFEPQPFNPNDPYLREKAICNLTDSNGPSVTVLLID